MITITVIFNDSEMLLTIRSLRHVIKPGMETGNETKRNEISLQSQPVDIHYNIV